MGSALLVPGSRLTGSDGTATTRVFSCSCAFAAAAPPKIGKATAAAVNPFQIFIRLPFPSMEHQPRSRVERVQSRLIHVVYYEIYQHELSM